MEDIDVTKVAGCDYYIGTPSQTPWGRVFGGQTLAMALKAAAATLTPTVQGVPLIHSLQAYFVVGGNPRKQILFAVDRARDGGSFQTRSVKALQSNQAILLLQASFHSIERGLRYQTDFSSVLKLLDPVRFPSGISDLPKPEKLLQVPGAFSEYGSAECLAIAEGNDWRLVYTRLGEGKCVLNEGEGDEARAENVHTQCSCLVFLSDYGMVQIARQPHRCDAATFDGAPFSMSISLDHAVHFHYAELIDVREWMVFHYFTNVSAGARGIAQLHIFSSKTGALLATVNQEALMRVPRDDARL
jgi:acyl-CoA thioesterase-2